MSIYYQDEHVTLHHGDALTETAWTEADVLVTDPPYGRAWRQGAIRHAGAPRDDTRNAASLTGIANDGDTSARDAVLTLWGDRPAIVFGDLMLAPPRGTRLTAVYAKPGDAGMRGSIGGIRRDVEAIYLLGKWGSGIGGRSSVFRTRSPLVGSPSGIVARSGGHPHAKPLDILEELITHTPPGSSIADPFAGSGSTLIAARALGRKAVGVELHEPYCELIAKRLDQGVLDLGSIA